MSANLKLKCKKFVHGHPLQKPGEEFALIADWCRKNDYAADVYGTGELINFFEKKIADLLGFEAACFMPSGTMAQQIALKIYEGKSGSRTFAIHPTSHLELHEQRAYAHLCNLKSVIVGDKNRQLTAKDIDDSADSFSTLIIELPAREIGGQLPDWKELKAIKKAVKKRGAFLHMDGARLWETREFYGKSYDEICAGFDSIYVSFYKGIGALTGAMLVGKADFISKARVWLRRFGGNLYQMHPFVASAAMRFDRALEQMPKYFERTKAVYEILGKIEGISFCPEKPQVNMFHLYLNKSAKSLTEVRDRIAEKKKIWLANNIRTTALENISCAEIYVGEGLLQISDDELEETFRELMSYD